jgi:hypothetical protein
MASADGTSLDTVTPHQLSGLCHGTVGKYFGKSLAGDRSPLVSDNLNVRCLVGYFENS